MLRKALLGESWHKGKQKVQTNDQAVERECYAEHFTTGRRHLVRPS